jgi:hypothetical protein
MRLRSLLVGIGLAASAAVGCSLIFDAGDFEVRGASTDSGDAATEAAAGVTDPCEHARPPARPPRATDPGAGQLVVALDHFAFVVGGRESLGYDLDGLCTCDDRPGSPSGGGPSCLPRKADERLCDEPGGRDNATATMLSRLVAGGIDGGLDVAYDRSATEGRGATLVEVAEFNGTSDDDAVLVALYDSPGLEPSLPCSTGTGGDAGTNDAGEPAPDWGGCDRWKRSTESLLAGQPRLFTRDAWVSGGTLVARFSVLPLRVDNASLVLEDVVLSGTLTTRPAALAGGLLAGRVGSANVLRVFGEQQIGKRGAALCHDPPTFAVLRAAVCDSLDLTSARPVDGGLVACDSISVTMELSGRAALLGAEAPSPAKASGCDDAGDFARRP